MVKWQLIFLTEMLKKAHKGIGIQMLNLVYEDFVTVFIKFVETVAPSYSEALRGSSIKEMTSAKKGSSVLAFLKGTVGAYGPLEQRRKRMFG